MRINTLISSRAEAWLSTIFSTKVWVNVLPYYRRISTRVYEGWSLGCPWPPSCKSFLSHRVKHDMEVDITIFDMVWPPPPLLKNPGYTPEVVRSCEFKGVVRYSISLNRHISPPLYQTPTFLLLPSSHWVQGSIIWTIRWIEIQP